MSDYRRLISYIYEYEGKEKGKNVGFVKLEARNGQCRLNLSVKKIYVGGNAIGVYLLGQNKQETFLGNIFVRGGNGEFRATVDVMNVEHSGNNLDTYYGLTVHDIKNSWRSYTTIWDDAMVPQKEDGESVTNDTAKHMAQEVLPDLAELPGQKESIHVVSSVVKEIEAEIAREEERKELEEQPMQRAAEIGKTDVPETGELLSETERILEKAKEPLPENRGILERLEKQSPESEGALGKTQELPPKSEGALGKTQEQPPETEEGPGEEEELSTEENRPEAKEEQPEDEKPGKEVALPSPELENPEVLKYLQETEALEADPEKIWEEFRKGYPKIRAFDYEDGCEILTVRPQDIGRLPRENWVFGSNSFLLHGYYSFRYLILVRLGNRNGRPRYLLGVPGHYFSNEKYMASMFGFPNFVLSKKQPPNDGRFGYWYTDIKIR